jgi:hypothetical protein
MSIKDKISSNNTVIGKSFLFISVSLMIREKAEKLVKSNKGRLARSINDSLDFLVVGDDKIDGYIKDNIFLPAKKMTAVKIIKFAEFESLFQNSSSDIIPKTKKVSNSNTISKSELVQHLWSVIGDFIYNHKYKITISRREGEYLENQGLANISRNISSSKVVVEIKVENFVDLNFKEDFANNFNTDKLKGDKIYKSQEIDNWINKSFESLHHLFSGFTVLGGEILFPEKGDNPWENSKTIYLEIPSAIFTLKEINKKWSEEKYLIEQEVFDSFKNEVIA